MRNPASWLHELVYVESRQGQGPVLEVGGIDRTLRDFFGQRHGCPASTSQLLQFFLREDEECRQGANDRRAAMAPLGDHGRLEFRGVAPTPATSGRALPFGFGVQLSFEADGGLLLVALT
jgi:hypothetical protein